MHNNTEKFLRALRYHIDQELDSYLIKSSHMAEALARSLGFNSAIALAQWANMSADERHVVLYSIAPFQTYLLRKGYDREKSNRLNDRYNFYQYFPRSIIRSMSEGEYLKYASASELSQMFILLMDQEDMEEPEHNWRQHVIKLWQVACAIACYKRDHRLEPITLSVALSNMMFSRLLENLSNPDLPEQIKRSIKEYLEIIPGFRINLPLAKQSQTALDFHGYLEMQFTRYLY